MLLGNARSQGPQVWQAVACDEQWAEGRGHLDQGQGAARLPGMLWGAGLPLCQHHWAAEERHGKTERLLMFAPRDRVHIY